MKKHLSKIIITTLILLAIASSMIFAGLLTTVPTFKIDFIYNLGTEKPILAVTVENPDIDVTDELIIETVEKLTYNTVTVNGSTVTITDETDPDNLIVTEYELLIFGDINGDKRVNVSDALISLNVAAKLAPELEGTDFIAANLKNDDEVINVGDALRLLRLIVKEETKPLLNEYKNELVIENYTLNATGVELEFNLDVEKHLDLAFPGAQILVYDEAGQLAIQPQVTLVENKATIPLTDSKDYTIKVEQGKEVLAQQAFTFNVVTFVNDAEGDYKVTTTRNDQEVVLKTIADILGKDDEKVSVTAKYAGVVDGEFSLVFEVYNHETEREEENLKETKTVGNATYDDTTKIVKFTDVDVTALQDGYVDITVKYADNQNYEAKSTTVKILKQAKGLEIVNTEINRNDSTATDSKTTTLALAFDLAEEIGSAKVTADYLLKPYVDGKAPEIADAETLLEEIAKDTEKLLSAQDVELTKNASNPKMVELAVSVKADTLQQKETKYKLFVVLNDGVNDTAVLAYDLPNYEAKAVADVVEVLLGEDGVVTWTPSGNSEGIVGYRLELYRGSSIIHTEEVSKTANQEGISLIEKIKEDGKAADTFYVKVIALGDGIDYLNAPGTGNGIQSKTITLKALNLGTIKFVDDPKNSTKIAFSYSGTAEEVEKIVADIDYLEISVYKDYVDDKSEPAAEFEAKLSNVEEDEDKKECVYTIDLADKMTTNGTWTVKVKGIAKVESLSLDDANLTDVNGTYVKASIKSVEKIVTHENASITVTAEGPATTISGATLNISYLDKYGAKVTDEGVTLSSDPIALASIVSGTEYSIKVELVSADGAILDIVENIKIKLDDKETLAKGVTLTRGGTGFVVTDEKITVNDYEADKADIANADFLTKVYNMLKDNDEVKFNEDGTKVIELTLVADDADGKARTITLDKNLLADEIELYSDAVELLTLKGTANDIVLEGDVIDIQGLKAGVIDISAYPTLRLSGSLNYDEVTGDIISAEVEPLTTFTVEGYRDFTFRWNNGYSTEISLQDGFLTAY